MFIFMMMVDVREFLGKKGISRMVLPGITLVVLIAKVGPSLAEVEWSVTYSEFFWANR